VSEAPQQSRSRLQLALIALVFLGPLGIATWLYTQGTSPSGRTNHGVLLEPIVSVSEQLSGVPQRSWVLLYRNPGECADACREALYTSRQARLMLGKEMDRVQRVFLHGESSPDTVFLADEHPGGVERIGLAGIADLTALEDCREVLRWVDPERQYGDDLSGAVADGCPHEHGGHSVP